MTERAGLISTEKIEANGVDINVASDRPQGGSCGRSAPISA